MSTSTTRRIGERKIRAYWGRYSLYRPWTRTASKGFERSGESSIALPALQERITHDSHHLNHTASGHIQRKVTGVCRDENNKTRSEVLQA
jgi:hypothetical protein